MDSNFKYFIMVAVLLVGLAFEGAKRFHQPIAQTHEEVAKEDMEPYARRTQLTDGQSNQRFQKAASAQAQAGNARFREAVKAQTTNLLKYQTLEEDKGYESPDIAVPNVKDPAAKLAAKDNPDKKKNLKYIRDEKGNRYIVGEDGKLKKVKTKKAKKKDKKTPEGEPEELLVENDQFTPPSTPDSSNYQVPGVGAPAPVEPVVAPEDKGPQDLVTAEEWKRLLLNQPDSVLTSKFIQAHQSSLVTDAAFYEIANAMLEDSRMPMRDLGLVVLGSSPGYQSFLLLAKIASEEPFGSDFRKKAEGYMHGYTALRWISVLGMVINAVPSPSAVYYAAVQISAAAQLHLKITTPPSNDPQQQNGTLVNAKYFTNLISPLEAASKNVKEASAQAQAAQTATLLKNLLGNQVAQNDEPVPGTPDPTQVP